MKMKFVVAACVALCGLANQASATVAATVCDKSTAVNMVSTCAPEISFYSAGSTAAATGVKNGMKAAFDTTRPIATLALEGNSNVYGYMGILGSGAGTAAGKVGLVFFNGTNGSIAGVAQLYSGLKAGSIEKAADGTAKDQKEYITLKVLTAADVKAGSKLTPVVGAYTATSGGLVGNMYVTTGDATTKDAAITIPALRNVSFATAWATDKQKVAHLAVSDVRPSEATPGQIAKVNDTGFPVTKLAMQGFGVAVNAPLYVALMNREIAAKRLPSSCTASVTVTSGVMSGVTGLCQPNLNRAEVASIMTGKITSMTQLGLAADADTKLTYYRRPNSSGTQAAAQLQFLGQGSFAAASKLTADADWSMGASIVGTPYAVLDANGVATGGCTTPAQAGSSLIWASTCTGTGDVIDAAGADTHFAIAVTALANKQDDTAAHKWGYKGAYVKLDGISPNFKADGSLDSNSRVGAQNGYPFVYELVSAQAAALAEPYKTIAGTITSNIANPANDVAGLLYIGGTVDASKAVYTRHSSNQKPLTLD